MEGTELVLSYHGRKARTAIHLGGSLSPLAVSAEPSAGDAAFTSSRSFSAGCACIDTATWVAQGLFLAGCNYQIPGLVVARCKCSMRPWLHNHCKTNVVIESYLSVVKELSAWLKMIKDACS